MQDPFKHDLDTMQKSLRIRSESIQRTSRTHSELVHNTFRVHSELNQISSRPFSGSTPSSRRVHVEPIQNSRTQPQIIQNSFGSSFRTHADFDHNPVGICCEFTRSSIRSAFNNLSAQVAHTHSRQNPTRSPYLI